MSAGTSCPVRAHREPHWVVTTYKANYSAFNGYRRTPSDYSEVVCTHPEHPVQPRWRTKAGYVDRLPRNEGLVTP